MVNIISDVSYINRSMCQSYILPRPEQTENEWYVRVTVQEQPSNRSP